MWSLKAPVPKPWPSWPVPLSISYAGHSFIRVPHDTGAHFHCGFGWLVKNTVRTWEHIEFRSPRYVVYTSQLCGLWSVDSICRMYVTMELRMRTSCPIGTYIRICSHDNKTMAVLTKSRAGQQGYKTAALTVAP